MSREGLKNFLHSVERSPALQRAVNSCSGMNEVVSLAQKYGYALRVEDLNHDAQAEAIAEWFKISTI